MGYGRHMGYEVTATKRRPQRFEDLVGQEFVSATLQNSIINGKIAPAYLFSGPRGCGKTSTARIVAKVLNCEKGLEHAPCGECSQCLEIKSGSSLDVIEIDGASNTGVNDVRRIIEEVLFPPQTGKYKIYIIDEVHMLSMSAFNALLKTIEEPPSYIVFIFATTELHKVPATIKSRCQQFHFRLGSVEQIKKVLEQALIAENIKADDDALYWIARESTGSFRDAYTLLDQVVAFSDGHVRYEKIRETLGLAGLERLNDLFEFCVKGDVEQLIGYIQNLLEAGISIEQLILDSADYCRNILLIKHNVTKDDLLSYSRKQFSEIVLNAWNTQQIERALGLFLQLHRDIRYSLNPRYELELIFMRLTWLASWVTATELKNIVQETQSALQSGELVVPELQESFPSPEKKTESFIPQKEVEPNLQNMNISQRENVSPKDVPEPIVNSDISREDSQLKDSTSFSADSTNLELEQVREAIITQTANSKIMLSSCLVNSGMWEKNGTTLVIPVNNSFTQQQLQGDLPYLSSLLREVFHAPIEVHVVVQKTEVQKRSTELPSDVELIRDKFRGTITEE